MRVTYLAHDLDDPSIWRRVRMLRQGGAQVRVAGFRRGQGALPEPATVLGRTSNGRMIQRVRAIAEAWPRIERLVPPQDGGPEVILARQGGGFRRVARLDTATAGFLAAADGEFTAGQLAGAIAGLLELDADGERHLLLAVADLLRDGFLIHCDAGHA